MKRFLYVAVVIGPVVTLAVAVADDAPAGGARDIEAVKAAWMKRFDNSRSFAYRVDATVVLVKGQTVMADDPDLPDDKAAALRATGGFPETDLTRPRPFSWIIDRPKGRFRKEETSDVLDLRTLLFTTQYQVNAYDGDGIWTENPRAAYPDGKRRLSLRNTAQRMRWLMNDADYPILFAHGIFPTFAGEVDWAALEQRNASHLALEAVGHADVRGVRCLAVRHTSPDVVWRDVFYVDEARDAAVVQWERLVNGVVVCRAEVETIEKKGELYIPWAWRASHYRTMSGFRRTDGAQPQLMEEVDAHVTAFEMRDEGDPAQFAMPRDPGTLVLDHRDGRQLAVGVDGKTLVPATIDAVEDVRRPNTVLWWLGVNAAVLAIVLLVWRLRRRQDSKA